MSRRMPVQITVIRQADINVYFPRLTFFAPLKQR